MAKRDLQTAHQAISRFIERQDSQMNSLFELDRLTDKQEDRLLALEESYDMGERIRDDLEQLGELFEIDLGAA